MSNTPDGGPAFPVFDERVSAWQPGMSLREWFAGQALPQAIEHERSVRAATIRPDSFRFDAVAEAAYQMADAMLRARVIEADK